MTETRTPHAVTSSPSGRLTDTTVRRLALSLSTGALTWSAVSFIYGFQPSSEMGIVLTDLGSFAFQFGALSLISLMSRTNATGVTRTARAMLTVERVLLALAMVWTVVHAFFPSERDAVWLAVLDAFWPLSMLGMFVISIKIALTGRWRGLARLWPLVAESWAVVTLPAMGILGLSAGNLIGASHLLVGYTTLGLIIAFRPELVRGEN
ncbi:hypothetical protein Aple_056900 [Acrocarpospora pleiomorpha]|uniref:Uncharacterized protein n=1 Tax=Acrocarpospora pleiomorpha TaxID=90975 RepID=A0A5M3XTF7_9ACTN|nr:hypothetical protein [Acrocarpospora pleiomorpha]GES22791.1 hypothetical protein Aple_056900 [Acrocarpospora pleiomorpha]